MSDAHKLEAAQAALTELDMLKDVAKVARLGLGTGSTAKLFVDLLGERVAQGYKCICVPTSEQTAKQAKDLNIPLVELDQLEDLHLTIDGTDEIAPDMSLIKGAGGALLREKIVASASKKMIVIADESKVVNALGAFSLPIEINQFAAKTTTNTVQNILSSINKSGQLVLRKGVDDTIYLTDEGHFIIDACFGRISDAQGLSTALLEVPGVVQHGLFLNLCQTAYIAGPKGVTKLGV